MDKDYCILLLEPDELIREAFFDLLDAEGYKVLPLVNPWEAFELIKRVRFEIGIMDANLGIFDILDLIRAIKELKPTPSLIITATNLETVRVIDLFRAGIEDLLLKPVNIEELHRALVRARDAYEERLERQRLSARIHEVQREKDEIEKSLRKAAHYFSLGELAKGLTHEFKNALTAVNLSLSYIKRNFKASDEKVKKHLNLMEKGIGHASELALRLLGLTREKEEEINLKRLLDETIEVLEGDFRSSGIRIIKDVRMDLPQLKGNLLGLRQVLINIMLNAKEAMEGGGQLSVRSYLGGKNEELVVIEVSDTGVGIPPEDLDKIFLPTYSTKEKGTGIGLYISKKIVEEMGGNISVKSELGKGTTFKIELPYLKEDRLLSEVKG